MAKSNSSFGASLATMTLVGTLAQVGMVVAGHYVPFIKDNVFAIGGMVISLIFGATWAATFSTSTGKGAGGGAIIGGICAIIGIAVSVVLGDTPAIVLSFGTLSSTATGALGGLVGFKLAANRQGSNVAG